MLVYICASVVIEEKQKLEIQAQNEDQSSATFVVFRAPLEFIAKDGIID